MLSFRQKRKETCTVSLVSFGLERDVSDHYNPQPNVRFATNWNERQSTPEELVRAETGVVGLFIADRVCPSGVVL